MLRYIFTAVSALILTACGGGGSSSGSSEPPPADPYAQYTADLQNGIYLFNYNCAGCHHSKATGALGPNIQGKKPADIRNALDTVAMMSYLPDFSDQELVDIASHLAALKQEAEQNTSQSLALTLELPESYAEVDVTDAANNQLFYSQHNPQQPLTSIPLHSAEFPLTIRMTDQLTTQSRQQTVYSPQTIDFTRTE